ncbi:MAG: Putative two-component response regulator [uncultured Sulfurovum sp.]|uniref:Two-component response regulator n=1 Tax=uncultured Sulfurovum sp. TaxID=269237 RepID=A0A6S6S1V9_9BACT|nr:MAG: Putative two-component response regulator [uncultured Sulfurovum sp.]
MEILKFNKLFFSGKESEILNFQTYFEEIILLENNQEILTFPFSTTKIIFMNCDEISNNCIQVIKEIRQYDRKSIIIIMSEKKDIDTLFNVLPLHLSGYIQKPFKKNNLQKLLENIVKDLSYLDNDKNIQLKNNYSLNLNTLTLLNEKHNIIKLTKKERKLIQILINKKNNYVTSETLEYTIWEEDSLKQDCNLRLKHLIYCLRKKLPDASIINTYNIGYKFVTN